MPVFCQGKQGAAVYIDVPSLSLGDVEVYEPSRDLVYPPNWGLGEKREPQVKTFLFESTPLDIRVETFPNNANDTAYWTVYTGSTLANGTAVESARGTFLKKHSQSFFLGSEWRPATRTYLWWIGLTDGNNGRLTSWTYVRANWISRIVYSRGSIPIFSTNMYIYSAEGFLANTYSLTQQWTVPTIEYRVHCGCEHNVCQSGTFPLKYCCFNCADSNRWLTQIRADCRDYKQQIQQKLNLPLT